MTGLREITTATKYWPEDNPMYHHVPSTAQDVRNKRKTEIDFLNGTIVRLGKKYGIPTPYNSMITNWYTLSRTTTMRCFNRSFQPNSRK